MWKSTYRYSQELEMMEFGEPLETPGSWFSKTKDPDFSELDIGEDVGVETTELDPWADDWEMDGESFLQDAKPEDIEAVDWEMDPFVIGQEELEEKAFTVADQVAMEAGEAVESAEVAEAVSESLEIAGEITEGAIAGAIGGAVISMALVIGSTMAGNYLLKKYRASILPEIADDNILMGATGYIVLGKIWLPLYVNEVIAQKGTDVAYIFYRDITNFPHWASVYVDDPTLQIIKPITTWGFWKMTPKMVSNGVLIEVPFYRELPIGTRVKLTTPYLSQFKGKTGTIRRGMIMQSDNTDGTYNKYSIQLDDVIDPYYELVYNFEVYDNRFTPKHYAKSETLKWGPWFKHKPKIVYKQKIQKQTFERKTRAQAFSEHKTKQQNVKENDYDYIHKYFDQTRDFLCNPALRRRLPESPKKKKPPGMVRTLSTLDGRQNLKKTGAQESQSSPPSRRRLSPPYMSPLSLYRTDHPPLCL